MDFRILGPLDVRDDDRELPLGGARQRALLGLLLLHANEVVSSDRLVDELWGEREGSKALQVAVSRLRKVIGSDALVTKPPGYELRVEHGQLDLHRFERLAADGRAALAEGDPERAADRLRQALVLWRGPPLADLSYEPSLQSELARLEEMRLATLEDRIDADLARGRQAQTIGELEALTAQHPLRERLRAQLMLALYRSGRQAEALDVYREARRVLVDELGIEPSRRLKELEQAILEQDAALEAQPRAPSVGSPEGLVGRQRELTELVPVVKGALAGRGAMVLIAGEPGIGKSRLAEALGDQARAGGGRVLVGRCWEAGGAPAYWPWTQALRPWLRECEPDDLRSWVGADAPELGTILPELGDLLPDRPEPQVPDSAGARFRVFGSLASLLTSAAAVQPLAIFLDDLHAADGSSVLLLQFVADAVGSAPILVVGCYRDTEAGPALAGTLPDLTRRPTVRRISLTGLSGPDTAALLELITGEPPSAELAEKVHAETEGNALFAVEVARLLASEGRLDRPADKLPVPEGVREAIARRLGRLSPECGYVLSLASALGREFDLEALERVSGLERDELFALLEEAIADRLVGELPDGRGGLRFSHVLIRDSVYESQPATRRLQLHREIGDALESLHAGNLDPHLAELAHHYLLAGAPGTDKAIRYAMAAGGRAASQLAFEEAARHYTSALELLERTATADEDAICELLLSLGDVLSRAGDDSRAKQAFRRAAASADGRGRADQLARAALGEGGRMAWARASTDPALVPLLERALAAVGDEDSSERVALLARLAAARRDDASRDRRLALGKEAVAIAGRIGDPETLAYALEGHWIANEGPGDMLEGREIGHQVARLGERIGDKERVFAAHDFLVHVYWTLADRAAVDVRIEQAAELADELRQPAQRWFVGTARTMLALMEGRFEDAEQFISNTLAVGERALSWNARVSERLGLFVLRHAQGRLAELEPAIARAVHEFPTLFRFRCALANVYAELGREHDAREALNDLLSLDLAEEHVDAEWLFAMSLLPDPCAYLGDREGAGKLYELLLPYRGYYSHAPVEAIFGSIARGLGVLTTALGRFDEAEEHFETALEIERRMRARPWRAHAQHDLAKMLLARGGHGDRRRASELLEEATRAYRDMGMASWAERAEARAASRSDPR